MSGIVVGVDGSEASLRAVDWAAAEAACHGAELTVCVVVYGPPEDAVLWVEPGLAPMVAEQIVEQARQRSKRAADAVQVDHRIVVGAPAGELLAAAQHAEMLVVGSRGLGAFTGLLLGSVSEQVAEHARCPVVVVRGESSNPDLPVLVGVDGSAANQPAVQFAVELADRRGVPVVALTAAPPAWIAPPLGYPTVPVPDPADRLPGAAQLLDQAVRPWAEKHPAVRVAHRLVLDSAAHALIQASAGSGLLVVGARGHGCLTGLLVGSVSRHALRHAECPVAVVHG